MGTVLERPHVRVVSQFGLISEIGTDPISALSRPLIWIVMRTRSAVERAIDDLARDRVLEYISIARRGGRSVITLVDVSEETALDPGTVEAVMAQLESGSDAPVRRAAADQLRWHIRR